MDDEQRSQPEYRAPMAPSTPEPTAERLEPSGNATSPAEREGVASTRDEEFTEPDEEPTPGSHYESL